APGVEVMGSVIGAGAEVNGAGVVRGSVVWPGARATAPLEGAVVTTHTIARSERHRAGLDALGRPPADSTISGPSPPHAQRLSLRSPPVQVTPDPSKAQKLLHKKIGQLLSPAAGERDLYAYVRDLLTTPDFGIGLDVDQVVIDSAVAGGRGAPDLVVYLTREG